MDKYCSNWLCEAEAVVEIPVQGETEPTRSLCACCKEAYDIGVFQGEQITQTGGDNNDKRINQ